MRRLVVVAAVVAAASLAAAAPLATISADLDGHGRPDTVELGDDGVLHIHAGAGSDVQLARGHRATLSVGTVGGTPAIVARLDTATDEVGYVVTRDARGWRVADRVAGLGDRGLDAEFSSELAATPAGVLRYQRRGEILRCDGKPAYLFAERFDGKAFAPLRTLPVDVDPAAPKLVARIDTAAAPPPIEFGAQTWVSSQRGAADAGELGRAGELGDGNSATAWDVAPGVDGEGQFVTLKPRAPRDAVQLRIVPGDHASATALARAARPKQLAIVTATGAWRVDLPDAARDALSTAYVVDLPIGVTSCVTVVVAAVYPGSDPLAISELAVYTRDERSLGPEALLAREVAVDAPGAKGAAAELVRHGAPAVKAIQDELAKTAEAAAKRRLIAALVKVNDPSATPALIQAAKANAIDDDDAEAVAQALAAQHLESSLHDLAASRELSETLRLAAAAALDATTLDGAKALADLAGMEPHALRRTVIQRLGAAPPAMLVAVAQATATPAASGDLWRAATRAARSAPEVDRAAVVTEMRAALAVAQDYDRHYSLVDGIATLGNGSDLAALPSAIAPNGSDSVAMREVAVRAIAAAPRADALATVLALVRDVDPGVRLEALAALMQAGDDEHGGPWGPGAVEPIDRTVAAALAGDSWPDIRVRAAGALASRCQRAAPAQALVTAATHDADIKVRGEALTALADACKPPGTGALLAGTFDDDKAPLELRTRAVSLAVVLGDPVLAQQLVTRFDTWRGNALQSKEAVALAMEAANAIGHLAPPGAATALEDALDDSAFPEIVGAAASALGTLGPACPRTAKLKLHALARSDDQQVRLPAMRAEKHCGR